MVTARSNDVLNPRISADDIRNWEAPSRFGRLDQEDVRQFLAQVAREVELLTEECANARRFPAAETAATQATHILISARRTAEQQVRGAQEQAREITTAAQMQFDQIISDAQREREEILLSAQGQAQAIVTEAAVRFPADAQAQITYLDSFTEFLTAQLRTAIDVLERRRPVKAIAEADGLPA